MPVPPRLALAVASTLALSACAAGPLSGRDAAPTPAPVPRELLTRPAPSCPPGTADTPDGCLHASDGVTVTGTRVHEPLAEPHPVPVPARNVRANAANMSQFDAPVKPLPCYRGGNAFQVLYAYPTGRPNRLRAFRAAFQRAVEQANGIVWRSTPPGNRRQLRVVTTPGCRPAVSAVALPMRDLRQSSSLGDPLRARGFDREDRKYVVFVDANVVCGLGSMYPDSTPGAWNPNNAGPSFARVDRGCWTAETTAHEMTHNLGAVMDDAPYTSKALHCRDERDVMCYKDTAATRVVTRCRPWGWESRLDCRRDTYFNVRPPRGSYLATHWNTADSSFLYGGGQPRPGARPDAPPEVTATATDTAFTVTWGPATGYPTRYLLFDSLTEQWRDVGLSRQVTVTGARPGTRYVFAVVASNPNGSSDTRSGTVVTTAPAPAPTPSPYPMPTVYPAPTSSPSPTS